MMEQDGQGTRVYPLEFALALAPAPTPAVARSYCRVFDAGTRKWRNFNCSVEIVCDRQPTSYGNRSDRKDSCTPSVLEVKLADPVRD